MTQQMVTITILGKEYTINCPKGQQPQLLRSAEELQNRILATQKKALLQNNQNILVMTALNLTHELLEAQALLDLTHTDKKQGEK